MDISGKYISNFFYIKLNTEEPPEVYSKNVDILKTIIHE